MVVSTRRLGHLGCEWGHLVMRHTRVARGLIESGRTNAAKFTRRLSCRLGASAAYYKYTKILIPLLPGLAPLLLIPD